MLSKAVWFALDPAIAAVVMDKETWSVVPDGTRLSKANLQIDVALMITLREEHSAAKGKKQWHVLKIDSSPQGGKDWMLTELLTLKQKDMAMLAGAFQDLAQQKQNTEEHIQASGTIFDILKSHILPPAALGSKRASVVYKSFFAFLN